MYDELVKMLRKHYIEHCPMDRASGICGGVLANEAADAIEYLMRKLESRESALNSVVECLDNSAVAATDVLNTEEDRIR